MRPKRKSLNFNYFKDMRLEIIALRDTQVENPLLSKNMFFDKLQRKASEGGQLHFYESQI